MDTPRIRCDHDRMSPCVLVLGLAFQVMSAFTLYIKSVLSRGKIPAFFVAVIFDDDTIGFKAYHLSFLKIYFQFRLSNMFFLIGDSG